MKKFNKIKKIFIFLIIIKRIKFFVLKISKYAVSGTKWLFYSKEHTNYTIKLDNQNLEIFSEVLSRFVDADKNKIAKKVNILQNTKIVVPKDTKLYERIDLDIKSKWDYRLIAYFLVNENKVKNIYEFGIDQGRLGYLLQKYLKHEVSNIINYTGIEYNKRKGVLLKNTNEEKFNIIYEKLEVVLSKFDKESLRNSLIISSTHEKNSEEFLFNYLLENNIAPKYIISDETSVNSPYRKFIEKENYSHTTFPFNDPDKFLDTFYVGLAKLN